MCRLCGNENERKSETGHLLMEAESLKNLAVHLEQMAWGRIKPHTDGAKKIVPLAHHVIRYLVEEYM